MDGDQIRHELGPPLAAVQSPGGTVASVHRMNESLWLAVATHDATGGSWTAAPAREAIAAHQVGETLVVGGQVDSSVASVAVTVCERTTQASPNEQRAWIVMVPTMVSPTRLKIELLDVAGMTLTTRILDVAGEPRVRRSFRGRMAQRIRRVGIISSTMPKGMSQYP